MAVTNSSYGITGLYNLCYLFTEKSVPFPSSQYLLAEEDYSSTSKKTVRARNMLLHALDTAFCLDGLGPEVQQADPSAVHLCD